ncbi:hypothetical protein SCACP_13060 [Sporomusa carbonis]|uniref:4Fe-4S dicluster domain-containing protein n=1 Tax=Sporomusa carbonis TaxID=3076075 RepID=UPI003A6E7F4C
MEKVIFFVVGDGEKCKHCLTCQAACPTGDIKHVPFQYKNGKLSYLEPHGMAHSEFMCSVCMDSDKRPACIEACPEQALRLIDVRQERKTKNKRAVIYLYKYWGGKKRV